MGCVNKHCECPCHKAPDVREKAKAEARENAHAAVKVFDHKPDLHNTREAILALQRYYSELI